MLLVCDSSCSVVNSQMNSLITAAVDAWILGVFNKIGALKVPLYLYYTIPMISCNNTLLKRYYLG